MDAAELLHSEVERMLGAQRGRTIVDLREYFTTYNGRFFERYSALGDEMRFDANDIAAAATLSVPLNGAVVAALNERADEFNELLSLLPGREGEIWRHLPSENETAVALYRALKSIKGLGRVRTSKLLASKRPHLIPIRDTYVERLLDTPADWWPHFEVVLGAKEVRKGLESLRAEAEVTPDVSLLRVLDVALWREGQRRSSR